MLVPLITLPYLIRVLGTEKYGLVVFAQVISSYFGVLIDFGFKNSATKNISIHRNDKSKLTEIISSVLIIKLFLWLISFAVLFVIVLMIPGLRKEMLLFLFSFGFCFNELLFPQWYFQGVERMKYITIINLISRSIFLALIFIIINDVSDYLLVPLLNSIGIFIGGILGLLILTRKDKVRIKIQPISTLKKYFIETLPLFSSNAIISVKDRMNVIFIGSALGMNEVTVYDLSIKIMRVVMQPIDIINTTIFPKMGKEKNMKFLLKTTKLTFFLFCTFILLVQPFLGSIVHFLGKGLTEAVIPSRILLLIPLIMVWSLAFGRNCLIASGKYKVFTLGMFLTTVFYLV
ncbi:MAG: oligosaccharide flippase family protein, partial [Clostridia bacterium]|nr:oligosaccharide flippase family protein [Clostridia bacterium]